MWSSDSKYEAGAGPLQAHYERSGARLSRSRALQPRLKDFRRGRGIERLLALVRRRTRFPQPAFGGYRRKTLVHERNGEAETAFEPPRKPPRKTAHFVFRAVRMHGESDDEPHRPPFQDELRDFTESARVLFRRDRGERMRDAHRQVADGDADALFAEVESEDRAGRFYACPAVSESFA